MHGLQTSGTMSKGIIHWAVCCFSEAEQSWRSARAQSLELLSVSLGEGLRILAPQSGL